jgi:hypothetical protein
MTGPESWTRPVLSILVASSANIATGLQAGRTGTTKEEATCTSA